MELHAIDHDDVMHIEVGAVEDDRSQAVMIGYFGDEPAPQVGWKLSTRYP